MSAEATTGTADTRAERIGALAKETLRANWMEGRRGDIAYAYTRPSPGRYPWQWYWDSCFAAIVWRRFDRDRSRAELESLLNAGREDGFIGHTIFWDHPVDWLRYRIYNVTSRRAFTTETIQPPLLAWGWRIAVGDPADEPRIGRHHEWLTANRDLDGDGLLWIIQSDESGLDASPKFDPVWPGSLHGTWSFPRLVRHNRKLGFDARAILSAGGPLVCEVLTNVLWCLSRLALGESSITPAMVDRLYDERTGLFLDEVRPSGARPEIETWAALAPLALPDLPEAIGRRLVEEHLLDPERFWLAVPIPSVAASEPSFEPGLAKGIFRRYWRGPSWVNTAWLISIGLARLGYTNESSHLADTLLAAVEREGMREYYHPRTGEGLGASPFAWSALAVELADPDPAMAASYLT